MKDGFATVLVAIVVVLAVLILAAETGVLLWAILGGVGICGLTYLLLREWKTASIAGGLSILLVSAAGAGYFLSGG